MNALRGEIWNAQLGQSFQNALGGDHPVVVVSVDRFNNLPLDLVWVVPGSTKNRVPQPFHVEVKPLPTNGLTARTWFKAEHLRSVDRDRLIGRRGIIDSRSLTNLLELIEQIIRSN